MQKRITQAAEAAWGVEFIEGCIEVDRDLVEGLLDLDFFVGLDDVTDHDVVVAIDIQTAVLPHDDFLSIVLVALERAEFAWYLTITIADEADLVVALDLPFDDHTAGDGTDLGDFEVCWTSRLATTFSLISGESIPSIADLMSSMVS